MTIELLYFDGCPNHDALLLRLRELLEMAGVAAEVELRRVQSPEEAERERFLGSPTLRVDGRDVDPGAAERDDFGLKCRPLPWRAADGGRPTGRLGAGRAAARHPSSQPQRVDP